MATKKQQLCSSWAATLSDFSMGKKKKKEYEMYLLNFHDDVNKIQHEFERLRDDLIRCKS